MNRQRTFFDAEIAADMQAKRGAPPCDPHVLARDVSRLTGQNAAILARLRRGPATTDELSRIALKYTSRLSDLRAAGFSIVCKRGTRGNNIYRLVEK